MSQRAVELLLKSALDPGFQRNFDKADGATSALQSRLEMLNRRAREMEGLNKAAAAARKAQRSMAGLRESIKEAGVEKSKQRQKITQLTSALEKQRDEVKKLTSAEEQNADEIAKARLLETKRAQALRQAQAALSQAERRERALGRSLKRNERQYHDQIMALRTYRRNLGNAGVDVRQLRQEQERLNRQLDQTRQAMNRSKGLGQNQGAGSGLGTAMITGASAATAYTGARIIRGSFERAMDFSHKMAQIDVIANVGPKRRMEIERELVDLSNVDKTNTSPTLLANEYMRMVQEGLDEKAITKALLPIGRTSVAATAETEDVSKTAAAIMRSLEIPVEKLQKSFDIAMTTADRGSFELKDMAKHLPGLAAIMKSMGQTGEGAVASLGAALQVAKLGARDPDEAANNLVNFLNKLADQETKMRFAEAGIDVESEFRKGARTGDVIGHMVRLIEKVSKGGDQFRIAELFRDRQVRAFLNPATANTKLYEEIRNQALKGEGKVDEAYKKMIAEPLEQWRGTMNQIEDMGRQLARRFLPPLNTVVSGINRAGSVVNMFLDRFPALGTMAGAAGIGLVGTAAVATLASPLITSGAALYSARNIKNSLAAGGLGTAPGRGGVVPVQVMNWPPGMMGTAGPGKGGRGAMTTTTLAAAGAGATATAASQTKSTPAPGGKIAGAKNFAKNSLNNVGPTILGYMAYETAMPHARPHLEDAGVKANVIDSGVQGALLGSFLGPYGKFFGAAAGVAYEAWPQVKEDFSEMGALRPDDFDKDARGSYLKTTGALNWMIPGYQGVKALGFDPINDMLGYFYDQMHTTREEKIQKDFSLYRQSTSGASELASQLNPLNGIRDAFKSMAFKPTITIHVDGGSDPQKTADATAEAARQGLIQALQDPSWLDQLAQMLQWPLAKQSRDLLYDRGGR